MLRTKDRLSLTIDKNIAKRMKEIMKESGLKLSTFTETMYKSVVDAETKPMKDVYEAAFEDLLKGSTKVKIKPKR